MTVAIDGPSGSGKSTIAKLLAEKYSLFNLNSGEFYRAFALYHTVLKNRSLDDDESIQKSLSEVSLALKGDAVCLNGEVLSKESLHTKEIDKASSVLSVNIEVRKFINEILREIAKKRDVICEGRDITSVVFPDAEVKIYLDATLDERARRRSGEQHLSFEETRKLLLERDERDMKKAFGALKKVKDVKIIDTTGLTISDVCGIISLEIEGCLQK